MYMCEEHGNKYNILSEVTQIYKVLIFLYITDFDLFVLEYSNRCENCETFIFSEANFMNMRSQV